MLCLSWHACRLHCSNRAAEPPLLLLSSSFAGLSCCWAHQRASKESMFPFKGRSSCKWLLLARATVV
jgi:hypothetical protein